jgi:hypothetical protein
MSAANHEREEATSICVNDDDCMKESRTLEARSKISSDKAEAEWAANPIEKAFNVLSIPAIIIGLLYYFFWVKPDREEKAKSKRS